VVLAGPPAPSPAEAGSLAEAGRTAARLARQVELAVAPLELTLAQYRVLCALGEAAEASSSLAVKLAVSAPSITTVVDGLVARGLASRLSDTEDRRRVSISLTADGEALRLRAARHVADRLAEIGAYLGSDELLERARQGLELWRSALDRDREHRHPAPVGAEAKRSEGSLS